MNSSTTSLKITIIILAAGDSTRMGSPKQLLKWGSSTLINHSIEQAANSKADSIFIVLGSNYEEIKDSIQNKSVVVLKNKEWKMGLGSSIAFGIQDIKNQNFDGVLLMLADQPQVDTAFLNKLISEFDKGQKPIIATKYTNTAGVPAVFDESFFKQLASLTGEKGGKQLINKNMAKATLIVPEVFIEDIDTPKAYESLIRKR